MKFLFYFLTVCVLQLQRLSFDGNHSSAVTAAALFGQGHSTFSDRAFANYFAMVRPEEQLQVEQSKEKDRKSVLGTLLLANYPQILSNLQLEAIVNIALRFPCAGGYVMSRHVPFMSDAQIDQLLAQDAPQQENATNREMSRLLDQSMAYIQDHYKRLSTYVAIMLSREYNLFEEDAEHVAFAAMLMRYFPNAWSEAGLAYLTKSPYYQVEEVNEVTPRAVIGQ